MDGMPALYPLTLRLAGRRVVVVGAGAVAVRRLPALLAAEAVVVVIDPQPSRSLEELAGQAADGRVQLVRRGYESGDLEGAWLVHACTSDAVVQEQIAADADAAGIWCIRADAAELTAAVTPASGTAD